VFVIGGAKVFEQFLPLCDKLYLTVLEKDFESDTFISPINFDDFSLVEKEVITDDTSVDFVYRYETWVRK
jgi:dihydrofolate reductase